MILAVLAAFALAAAPTPAPPPGTVQAGLQEYQALLDRYLRRIQPAGAPLDTRMDYEQVYVDDKIWTLHRSERLDRIHAELLSAAPSTMSAPERTAWALNTYNFLVIKLVTENLLVPNRQFERYTRVDDIVVEYNPFFATEVAVVEGVKYSLARFERRFVLGDTTVFPAPSVPPRDPRVLFAVNSGRIGHPPLMPRAYRADSLDRQLDAAVRATLALPRFVSLEAPKHRLLLSNWLADRVTSLGGTPAGIVGFVRRYAPRPLRDALAQRKATDITMFTRPDMKLNQVEHPKVIVHPLAPDKKGST